jgi:hypothetical protein
MKTALGLYLTSTTTPYLGGLTTNTACKASPSAAYVTGDNIFYSVSSGSITLADAAIDGGSLSVPLHIQVATPALTDGTGWIPVNFDTLVGGSPISNLPVDPTNIISLPSNIVSTDLVYRYACSASPLVFEIDAVLESAAYTVADNKLTTDGGNNSSYYEVGTNLKIIGTGTDF